MISLITLSIVALGTWLSTSSVESTDCGYHATGLEGTITGPFTKGTSSKTSLDCEWTITVPSLYRISISFGENSIPTEKDYCSLDWVLIASMTESGVEKLHGIYCGRTTVGTTVTSVENRLRIKYHNDGHYYTTDSYFSLKYKAVPLKRDEIATFHIENRGLQKENLAKAVSSLFLVNENYFKPGNAKAENITNRFRLQLGEELVRNFTRPMAAADLSLRISGLIAVCINPRSFYGVDLVYHLNKLVNNTSGIPNPYVYLTLCNAGDEITENDVKILTNVVETKKHEVFWLDYQAMALLALVCIRERDLGFNVKNAVAKAMAEIKSYQLQDGGFGSLQTTSLAIQALTAAETSETGWNRTAAMNFIERAKHSDSSFGSIQNLFDVTPVTNQKTLLYINVSKCDFSKDETNQIRTNQSKAIQLTYSVWIGDHVDMSSTVTLKAPKGTKFFDFMRLAADQDEKFKFKWINMRNAPYIYELGGLINDPSSGRYWTLYTGTHAVNLQPFTEGLENYIPKDGEMAAMWYKTVVVGH